MPILRLAHERDYFSCSRYLPQDENISLEAVGLMAYLLSKPDGWEVQFEDIEKRGKFGRDVRRRLFTELEKAGYFERRRVRTDLGQWDYELLVHETPLPDDRRTHLAGEKGNPPSGKPSTEPPSPENPSPDFPSTVQPSPEKAAIIENTELQSTERENTEREKSALASSVLPFRATPVAVADAFEQPLPEKSEWSVGERFILKACGLWGSPAVERDYKLELAVRQCGQWVGERLNVKEQIGGTPTLFRQFWFEELHRKGEPRPAYVTEQWHAYNRWLIENHETHRQGRAA